MPLPRDLSMKISQAAFLKGNTGQMVIIIQRPYAHLAKEICRTFEDGNNTSVVIERRMGERRGITEPVKEDRRHGDRRAHKEKLLEVVISL